MNKLEFTFNFMVVCLMIGIYLGSYAYDNYGPVKRNLILGKPNNNITYSFSENQVCSETEKNYVRKAFDILENKTGVLNFKEVSLGNIQFNCSNEYNPDAYGVAEFYVNDYEIEGEIYFYDFWKYKVEKEYNIYEIHDKEKKHPFSYCPVNWKCYQEEGELYPDYPTIEIHEILHLFEFDDDYKNENSIMYYEIMSWEEKEIDEWIIEDLINTYS